MKIPVWIRVYWHHNLVGHEFDRSVQTSPFTWHPEAGTYKDYKTVIEVPDPLPSKSLPPVIAEEA